MNARLRLTFFCGTCLGLAVGFAVGHVSVWQRAASSRSMGLSFNEPIEPTYSASIGAGGVDLPALGPAPEIDAPSHVPVPGGAVVLNDPDLGDEPVHADALVEIPPACCAPAASPPQALPIAQAKPLVNLATSTPVGLQPVPSHTQQAQAVSPPPIPLDPEVVRILKDELEGVSEQQREVWADALQGMKPADAAGVILMWKRFGQNGPGPNGLVPNHLSGPPPLFRSSHPDAAPIPLDAASNLACAPGVSPLAPTGVADLGLRIEQHNQANQQTCGYLNMIPVLQETAFDASHGSHVEIIGYRLDIEPGRHVETGNPAHVSVQRDCFFAVKLPTGEEQYTRVGRLVLDAERRLCVDLGDRDLPITPEVKLPEGATRFLARSGQLMIAVEGQGEPVTVGPLQVAEFFDASRLQPVGGCVYQATTASGKPKMVAAELIHQTLEYPRLENTSRVAGR